MGGRSSWCRVHGGLAGGVRGLGLSMGLGIRVQGFRKFRGSGFRICRTLGAGGVEKRFGGFWAFQLWALRVRGLRHGRKFAIPWLVKLALWEAPVASGHSFRHSVSEPSCWSSSHVSLPRCRTPEPQDRRDSNRHPFPMDQSGRKPFSTHDGSRRSGMWQ